MINTFAEEIESISAIYGNEVLLSSNAKACILFLSPYTGQHNISLLGLTISFFFNSNYPFSTLEFHIDKLYGLAEDEISELNQKIRETIDTYSKQNISTGCKDGYLFHLIDDIRGVLSNYNDNVDL